MVDVATGSCSAWPSRWQVALVEGIEASWYWTELLRVCWHALAGRRSATLLAANGRMQEGPRCTARVIRCAFKTCIVA